MQLTIRLGLVDYVADLALQRAFELAEEIKTGGLFLWFAMYSLLIVLIAPLALRAAKLAIKRGSELPLEAGLDFERACYQPLLQTKDRLEALKAFQAKRKPIFKGE